MKKRGQIKVTWTVIGAVLAAAVILLFTFVFITFSGVFKITSEAEQAAINNFKVLGKTINELLVQPGIFATARPIQFQVPNGFIVVGFDKNWYGDGTDSTEDNPAGPFEASICHDEGIDKPDQCLGQACICLFQDTYGDDFKEDDSGHVLIDTCITFDGDVSFSGPADNNLNLANCEGETGTSDYDADCQIDGEKKYPVPGYGTFPGWRSDFYEFLIIYGECGDEFGEPKTFYVEKYVDISTQKTYIFIANKTAEIEQREKNINDIIAKNLLDNGMSAFNSNEFERAILNFRQVIDSYPNTTFANNAKIQINNICSRDPKPQVCENIDAKYLP
ncbi:hypothetical protein KY343_00705 [Candidatus Woesearchaeota archaeon]|nr:hypothetical protein [Candidatus Woesearchaeota archaeon]